MRKLGILAVCFALAVPIGAIGRAYANSCVEVGPIATLQVVSVKIDGVIQPNGETMAPVSTSLRTGISQLIWANPGDEENNTTFIVETP